MYIYVYFNSQHPLLIFYLPKCFLASMPKVYIYCILSLPLSRALQLIRYPVLWLRFCLLSSSTFLGDSLIRNPPQAFFFFIFICLHSCRIKKKKNWIYLRTLSRTVLRWHSSGKINWFCELLCAVHSFCILSALTFLLCVSSFCRRCWRFTFVEGQRENCQNQQCFFLLFLYHYWPASIYFYNVETIYFLRIKWIATRTRTIIITCCRTFVAESAI